MTTDLFVRYAELDPVESPDVPPDWADILAAIDERAQDLQRGVHLPTPAPSMQRGIIAAAAAFTVVVALGLALLYLSRAGEAEPAGPTPISTTVASVTPTTAEVLRLESQADTAFTVESYNERSAAVGWSVDGAYLITAVDGFPTIWDAGTGRPLDEQQIDHISGVTTVVRNPDRTVIDGATEEGEAFYDAVTGERLFGSLPEFLAFSPDGRSAAVGGAWGAAAILDAATGEAQLELPFCPGPFSWVWAAAWSPDGTRLATTCSTTVTIWDTATGDELLAITSRFEPKGERMVIEDSEATGSVTDVAWSPDGSRIATVSRDSIMNTEGWMVEVWDATSGDDLLTFSGLTGRVWTVAWSPDGTRLAVGSSDGTATVWDADSGTEQTTLTGHTDEVTDVAWSPDGTRIATASLDGTVKVWSVEE